MEKQKEKIDKTNLPNIIAQQIIAYIEHHNLQVGDKLPSERVMSEMFNVSRVSLREAVRGLVIINLLEVINGKGIYVKNPKAKISGANLQMNIHKDQLIQLTEVRRMLELKSIELVAKNIQEEDFEELYEIIRKMEYEFVLDEDLVRLDDAFHRKLNQLSGNEVLFDLLDNMIVLSKQIWSESGSSIYQAIRESTPLHRDICEALQHQNTQAALSAYKKLVEKDISLLEPKT